MGLKHPKISRYSAFRKYSDPFTFHSDHLPTIWSVTAKGLNTFVNEKFQFLISNKLAKMSKGMFSLSHYGLLNAYCLEKMPVLSI